MKKSLWSLFIVSVLYSFSAYAAGVDDILQMDKNARSSGSKSIMFRKNNNEAANREQEQAKENKSEASVKRERPVFQQYNLFGSGWNVAATVNGDMVSNKDLQERANLLVLTTGMQINAKNKKLVIEKVMQNVIDEKVKMQEAEKQHVFVSDEEVKEAYRNFEKSNGIPAGKFQNVLKQYRISNATFMNQIKANLLWNKLVARRMSQNVDVSVKEVEDEFLRIKKDMDTPKYMVSEIVIKRKDADHIEELVEILRNDPRFELYAAQFSQAASAPSGGKLGWVAPGQLPQVLDSTIRKLKKGQVSNAVLYRSDYYIFKMDKVYDPKSNKQDMPSEEEVRTFIKDRKVDEQANKYIRDLRNRAVVERKF